ncbi:TPA: phage GP46 family protein [Pasteurella multocida]|uniref:phage GP46 family protein n=1 Tax=Pasteurella multocida TaxID=747 RepID=UPI000C17D314|nr:phage GP46 family protein [Pasteurella multocida]HDR1414529.1 phage GP46 family protein [Pasteurella multocida]
MSDLALTWVDGHGDLVVINDELMLDNSLTTSIIISLFTDLRVDDSRGWWGDDFNSDNHQTGSKLWLLNREKQLKSVLDDAQTYATQALSWLVKDKEIKDYQVIASNPETSVLLLTIIVELLDGSQEQFTFSTRWSD